jgi:hypothetical protein
VSFLLHFLDKQKVEEKNNQKVEKEDLDSL